MMRNKALFAGQISDIYRSQAIESLAEFERNQTDLSTMQAHVVLDAAARYSDLAEFWHEISLILSEDSGELIEKDVDWEGMDEDFYDNPGTN